LARGLSHPTVRGGGGLLAHYYSTGDLSGAPFLVREERCPLKFEWGKYNVVMDSANRVSVLWTGLLASPETDFFRFNLQLRDSNDESRLLIDNDLVAETKLGQNNGFGHARLIRGALHTIALEFYATVGQAAISLEWASTTIARQPITSFFLYPRWQSLMGSPFPCTVASYKNLSQKE